MRHEAEMRAILKQVELWPAEERIAFAREAKAVADRSSSSPLPAPPAATPRESLSALIGIANPTGRSFTDEEVDQLRLEALVEKHLR